MDVRENRDQSSPKYQVFDNDDADGSDEGKISSGAQIAVRQNGGRPVH